MPLNTERFDRYAQAEKRKQRAMFETEEVVRVENRDEFAESQKRFRIPDADLIAQGLAPYPRFLDLPRGIGKLPALARMGVKLPNGVPAMLEEFEVLQATHADLGKRASAASARAKENAIAAQKDRVRQLREGVKPEDLEPYVAEGDGEPFSLTELLELKDNARIALEMAARDIAAATTQDVLWPRLAEAWHNSFVPFDFSGTKAQIEQEERDGEKLRRAIMDYQLNVGFYPDERGARLEYKNLSERLGIPANLDDWTSYRGGEITLGQFRIHSDDERAAAFDPSTALIVVEEDEEDAA